MEICTELNGQILRCTDFIPIILLMMIPLAILTGALVYQFITSKSESSQSEKKSYEQEMSTYDHLETKAIDHLPTGISLDELRLNDGEIPDRVGRYNE